MALRRRGSECALRSDPPSGPARGFGWPGGSACRPGVHRLVGRQVASALGSARRSICDRRRISSIPTGHRECRHDRAFVGSAEATTGDGHSSGGPSRFPLALLSGFAVGVLPDPPLVPGRSPSSSIKHPPSLARIPNPSLAMLPIFTFAVSNTFWIRFFSLDKLLCSFFAAALDPATPRSPAAA